VLPEDVRTPSYGATGHPVGFEHHRGNGNGNGHAKATAETAKPVEAAAPARPRVEAPAPAAADAGAQTMLGKFSGDAPFCDHCGHITIRNGTCFKCLNCGSSMGCS